MKTLLKILSMTGLMMTLVPSFLVFGGLITLDSDKWLMLLGTVLWFVTAPFWMNQSAERKKQSKLSTSSHSM